MKKVIFKSLFTSILLVLGLSVGVKQTTHEVVEAAENVSFEAEFTSSGNVDFITNCTDGGSDYLKLTKEGDYVQTSLLNDGEKYTDNITINAKLGTYGSGSSGEYTFSVSLLDEENIVKSSIDHVYSVTDKNENYKGDIVLSILNAETAKNLKFELKTKPSGYRDLRLQALKITYVKDVVPTTSYTITLHYNDEGVTPNKDIESSLETGKFPTPETPTRTGYVFDGWYTDVTFENLFDFENTFATENIDLYAKWVDEKDTYLQTTSFALGFDYSLNSGIINDASEVTNGLYTISAVVGDKYTVATNTLVTSSVGSNHVLSVNETTEDSTSILNHYTDLFYINKVNDKYTIQTMDGKYLTYGNTTSIELNLETEKTNNSEWTIENNTTTAPGTISIRKSDSFLLGYNTYEGRNEFGVCRSSYNDWYNLELTKIDVATSNYALRFGTEITTENYAKLGKVVSYGVLVAPTAKLGDVTFKDLCSTAAELSTLIELTEALNITNAKMQTTETGYSFGGLLQNVPETQIHTSVSAACYVVNADGEIFFAEQKDMSIVGAATYYAEHAAELGLNETETTLVNVLKGM